MKTYTKMVSLKLQNDKKPDKHKNKKTEKKAYIVGAEIFNVSTRYNFDISSMIVSLIKKRLGKK